MKHQGIFQLPYYFQSPMKPLSQILPLLLQWDLLAHDAVNKTGCLYSMIMVSSVPHCLWLVGIICMTEAAIKQNAEVADDGNKQDYKV